MHRFQENILWSAIDLNDTVIFEYDIEADVISFSDNISKYIPLAHRIEHFVEKINQNGKIHEDDVKKAITFMTSQKQLNMASMEYIRLLDVTGEFRWYQLKGMIPTHRADDPALFCGTISYIADDRKQFDEERALKRVDVTGLITEDTLRNLVKEYISAADNDVKPALIVVEIDGYEGFIERYGEVSGEGLQLEIARILKKAFRGSDLIGQLAKDRFAVFMKGVRSSTIVLERSKNVNETIKQVSSRYEDERKSTVSIGASIMSKDGADFEELYKRCFVALDEAKSSGQDTYIILDEDMERMDATINPVLSTKEMELVRTILDPISTWAYVVDEDYQILYRNSLFAKMMSTRCEGYCYVQNRGKDFVCEDCPLKTIKATDDSMDSEMYSPIFHKMLSVRTTRIVMRNGKSIFVIAAINENIEEQIGLLEESEDRIRTGLFESQDIIWDINLTKNSCIRVKENGVFSVMDLRVKNFRKLADHYASDIIHPEDKTAFIELTDMDYLKRMIKTGRSHITKEIRVKNAVGEYEWMAFYTYFLKSEGDLRVIISALNVNEFKRASLDAVETKIKYEIMKEKTDIMTDMALSYERHENVNEMIGILVYEYSGTTNEYYLCSNFDEVFKINHSKLTDEWAVLNQLEIFEDDREIYEKFVNDVMNSPLVQKVTVRIKNRFDVFVWYTITIQALRGINNEVVRYLCTLQNVDTEMKIKGEMAYRADYDSVTGIFNSEAFYRRTSELINRKQDTQFAIFSIDVDKFRLINETYGIEEGNRFLNNMGKAIKTVIPKDGYAKRYQGDVFSVVIPYENEQQLIEFMTEFSAKANEFSNIPAHVTFTFGIYKIVDRELPIRIMCDRARAAKRQLKGSASASNYAVYDDTIRLKLKEQAEIEERMEDALKNREFVMFLQPQIDVESRKIYGAEALVRWNHPVKGIMVPFQFLDLFESNGFIVKLDKYMWEEACKYLAELKKRGIEIPIAVNISRAHIGATNLTEEFTALVKKYDIEPSKLELEITENLFMDDVTELFDQMSSLKQNGFSIHMDDFGSAYSSLNMLRNAPVDTLKIDKYFFDEIMTTERGRIIVESSVRMAKQLGLMTIAEGVETEEQLNFLEKIGCDIVQGYYFSRPVSIDAFEQFVENWENEK